MEKKNCLNCEKELNICEFHYSKSEKRWRNECKACRYEYQKQRWRDRKIKAVELMGGKCMICEYNKNYAALAFHHIDPTQKEFVWNEMRLKSWKNVVSELKKCILLCSNCHLEIHNPNMSKQTSVYNLIDNALLNCETRLLPTGNCCVCKEDVFGTKYCSVKCAGYASRKVAQPSKEELDNMLKTMSFVAIGKFYNVSDNAVRKWAKRHGLVI